MASPHYDLLRTHLAPNDDYAVAFYPTKGSMSNSDYKNFKAGLCIMACKRAPLVGYYTPRIHTAFDTEASSANIAFLSDRLTAFAQSL